MERVKIQQLVLATVAFAGILAITAVAPNTLQAFAFLTKRHRRYQSPALYRDALSRLKERGFIEFGTHRGASVVCITLMGKRELLRYQLREKSIRSVKWDGKWRMVIFDIYEYKRQTRNRMRHDLLSFGFQRLQNSVWVYPYPCEDIIALLKADHRIGKELLHVTADTIENDRWLKHHFGL